MGAWRGLGLRPRHGLREPLEQPFDARHPFPQVTDVFLHFADFLAHFLSQGADVVLHFADFLVHFLSQVTDVFLHFADFLVHFLSQGADFLVHILSHFANLLLHFLSDFADFLVHFLSHVTYVLSHVTHVLPHVADFPAHGSLAGKDDRGQGDGGADDGHEFGRHGYTLLRPRGPVKKRGSETETPGKRVLRLRYATLRMNGELRYATLRTNGGDCSGTGMVVPGFPVAGVRRR